MKEVKPALKLSPGQRSIIAVLLIFSAIVWIVLSLWNSIDQLPNSLSALRPLHIAIAGIFAMVSVYITAYMFFLILSGIVPIVLPSRHIVLSYLSAQIVRYLPGKIWGILFLTQAIAGQIPGRYTVRATILQFALITINSIVVALSVYAYYHKGTFLALIIYTTLLLSVSVLLRTDVLHRVAALITLDRDYKSSRMDNYLLLTLLQAEWMTYLIACRLMLPSHVGPVDAIIVGTVYALAWLAGALALVLPGGLFVREGAFLLVSSWIGFKASDMFLFSIVARIVFTLSDTGCAAIGIVLMRARRNA